MEKGFQGTELQWLDSLRGKDGTPGERGADGRERQIALERVEVGAIGPGGCGAHPLGQDAGQVNSSRKRSQRPPRGQINKPRACQSGR